MAATALNVEDVGGVTVVGFRDASMLDMVTIQRVSRELYDVVEGQGKRKIALDFKEVRFLASQALGMLLTLRRKAEAAGATVVICGLRPELARVFHLTNLDRMFDFLDTSAEAITKLGGTPPT